ncbi:MAG: hypothetical protein JEZ08_23735 [Clostridiales bacterium]|nr:hypothetical protein [Clostridiales bacterium]
MKRKLGMSMIILIQVLVFWHWNTLANSVDFEFGSEFWNQIRHLNYPIIFVVPIVYFIIKLFIIKEWKLLILCWIISFFIVQGVIVKIYGVETLMLQLKQFGAIVSLLMIERFVISVK